LLTDSDLAKIQDVTSKISAPLTIYINQALPDDQFGSNLTHIAAQISGVSMNRILLEPWTSSVFADKPGITLSVQGSRNIHYLAAPEGTELDPFLDALKWISGAEPAPAAPGLQSLQALDSPVRLLVLMAAACPHCPTVVRNALSAAIANPLISLAIIDAVHFNDIADHYKVKSTPTVIIDDGFTSVGALSLDQLVERLTKARDDESLTATLDSMLKAGRSEDAARLLCREIRPQAILPIYLSHEFSTRMGALVVMEEALSIDPHVMDSVIDELIGLLFHEEIALRGDTAELLGKIGHPSAVPALRKVHENDSDPDVREAAADALEALGAL
jgi:hypothetical protein